MFKSLATRQRLLVGTLVSVATLAVPAGPRAAQNLPSLLTESTVVRSYDGRSMPAETLRLTVPARRGRTGPTISVVALRVRSTAAHPGNPIVFLMGGPGIPGSVMAPIPPYFTLFERLRALGDVIIVDQRGIGSSEPALDCPFDAALPIDAFVDTRRLVGTIQQRVAACAAQWRAKAVEPKDFNTLESADDIADLRRALGAEKIDLLAFSYGTRLALAFVQRHGDHVGRVVLQGVNGPGLVVKRPGPVTRKLQRIGALLKQDASWQGPTDLVELSQKARMRLAGAPAAVTITDQRSAQPMTLQVSRQGFDAIVSLNLDDARLPALLLSVAEGDDRVLTRFVEAAWNGLGNGTVGLMARAVNCAADRPAARRTLAAREGTSAPFGEAIDNEFLTPDFCRAIGYDTPPVEFARPVQSAALVLMLTGALDATNPIENAREVARGFPNATVLEIENAAHEALTVPAVQDAVVDFLGGTSLRDRPLTAAVPRFASIAEALQPTGRGRGGLRRPVPGSEPST